MLGPPDLNAGFGRGWAVRAPSSSPSCVGQDSPIPYPYPPPGCPAARHDRPTWNVYHVILELSGEKCVPRLQTSQPRQSLGVPRGLAAPRANPSPSLAGGWRRESPVPSGARSRRIRSMFSTQPGTTSFRPGRPDPRFGSDQGSTQDPRRKQRKGPGATPAAPLLGGGRAGSGGSSGREWITTAASYVWGISKKSSLQ